MHRIVASILTETFSSNNKNNMPKHEIIINYMQSKHYRMCRNCLWQSLTVFCRSRPGCMQWTCRQSTAQERSTCTPISIQNCMCAHPICYQMHVFDINQISNHLRIGVGSEGLNIAFFEKCFSLVDTRFRRHSFFSVFVLTLEGEKKNQLVYKNKWTIRKKKPISIQK